MKTPRDVLFERHRSALPKLDVIRQSTVAAVCDRQLGMDDAGERRSQTAAYNDLACVLAELIWPSRRIWAGLASVWVLIFIFDFSQRDRRNCWRENFRRPRRK